MIWTFFFLVVVSKPHFLIANNLNGIQINYDGTSEMLSMNRNSLEYIEQMNLMHFHSITISFCQIQKAAWEWMMCAKTNNHRFTHYAQYSLFDCECRANEMNVHYIMWTRCDGGSRSSWKYELRIFSVGKFVLSCARVCVCVCAWNMVWPEHCPLTSIFLSFARSSQRL